MRNSLNREFDDAFVYVEGGWRLKGIVPPTKTVVAPEERCLREMEKFLLEFVNRHLKEVNASFNNPRPNMIGLSCYGFTTVGFDKLQHANNYFVGQHRLDISITSELDLQPGSMAKTILLNEHGIKIPVPLFPALDLRLADRDQMIRHNSVNQLQAKLDKLRLVDLDLALKAPQ